MSDLREILEGNMGGEDPPPVEAPTSEPASEPVVSDFPSSWKKDLASSWPTLDESVRAEILRRESDIHTGIAGYKGDADSYREFKALFDPLGPALEKEGLKPAQVIKHLLGNFTTLEHGTPKEKKELIDQIVAYYKVPQGELTDQEISESTTSQLQAQLRVLTEKIEGMSASQAMPQVEAFAKDHVHFNKVQGAMAKLLDSGMATSMEEAYDQAVWATPGLRADLIKQQTAEAAKAALLEAKKRQILPKSGGNESPMPKAGLRALIESKLIGV